MSDAEYRQIKDKGNAEYVTEKVAGMVRHSAGGASVYTEVISPHPGPELIALLVDAVLQVNNLVAARAGRGAGTARACVLITLEPDDRPEGDAAGLPA